MGRGTRPITFKVTGIVHYFMPLGVTRSSLTDIRIKIPPEVPCKPVALDFKLRNYQLFYCYKFVHRPRARVYF